MFSPGSDLASVILSPGGALTANSLHAVSSSSIHALPPTAPGATPPSKVAVLYIHTFAICILKIIKGLGTPCPFPSLIPRPAVTGILSTVPGRAATHHSEATCCFSRICHHHVVGQRPCGLVAVPRGWYQQWHASSSRWEPGLSTTTVETASRQSTTVGLLQPLHSSSSAAVKLSSALRHA
jgi:hypothetical protein